MAEFISNLVQNSVTGLVSGLVGGAVTTVGGYAGNAVNGVGNLIEGSGRAVGDGYISKGFEGVGQSINSYGTSIRNATAPNAGSSSSSKQVAVRKPKAGSKSAAGGAKGSGQKALAGSSAQKVLPSTKAMKALPAPAAKEMTSQKGSEISKGKARSVTAASPYRTSANSRQVPAGLKSDAEKKTEMGNRFAPKMTPSGKVSISAASRPQTVQPKVAKPSLTYPMPAPAAAGSEARGSGDVNWAPSNVGVAATKGASRKYQHLPDPSKGGPKASSKAASQGRAAMRGAGKKASTMPPASKANSMVGAGPKFF